MTHLAIDLFCGLGGWTDGLLAEGYYVVGFDIERHDYGDGAKYPAQLVLQDVMTLHGRQFKDAALIVASPPCQKFSYMAMPWSKAKAIAADYRSGVRDVKKLTALFDACFRIQREACEAAGHHIPLVVENVCGAQKWVGRARWNFGSFYLWGDVPALMPMTKRAVKSARPNREGVMAWTTGHLEGYWESNNPDGVKTPGFRFDGSGGSFQTANVEQTGFKSQGMNWSNREIRGQDFTRVAAKQRDDTTSWHGQNPDGRKGVPPRTAGHWTNPAEHEGVKQHGSGREWFAGEGKISRMTSSKSNARKAASAAIAKIPFVLAQHVARSWKPANFIEQEVEAAA